MPTEQKIKTGCECTEPGFCKRHDVRKGPGWYRLCQNDPRYFARWEEGTGPGQNPPDLITVQLSRGVGDTVAKIARAVGINPCGGCEKRQGWLNRIFPYGKNKANRQPPNPSNRTDFSVFTYIPTSRLVKDTYRLVGCLPPEIAGVIGIARSGLIPASLLAAHLHVPLLAVSSDGLRDCGSGTRLLPGIGTRDTLLLIDDTIFGGRSLRRVLPLVRQEFPSAKLLTAAIYVTPSTTKLVDYHVMALPGPHWLEWNLFNSVIADRAAFDFDGILCEDISAADLDSLSESRYLQAIQTARPKYYCRRNPIPLILTARLERYREPTLEWLARHRMTARQLVMGPWANPAERYRPGEVVKFKAEQYGKSSLSVLVESDPRWAAEIAKLSGKKVLCPPAGKVFG